jgi:hypothetical protein
MMIGERAADLLLAARGAELPAAAAIPASQPK